LSRSNSASNVIILNSNSSLADADAYAQNMRRETDEIVATIHAENLCEDELLSLAMTNTAVWSRMSCWSTRIKRHRLYHRIIKSVCEGCDVQMQQDWFKHRFILSLNKVQVHGKVYVTPWFVCPNIATATVVVPSAYVPHCREIVSRMKLVHPGSTSRASAVRGSSETQLIGRMSVPVMDKVITNEHANDIAIPFVNLSGSTLMFTYCIGKYVITGYLNQQSFDIIRNYTSRSHVVTDTSIKFDGCDTGSSNLSLNIYGTLKYTGRSDNVTKSFKRFSRAIMSVLSQPFPCIQIIKHLEIVQVYEVCKPEDEAF
jgi:hypothetical protein